MSGRLFDRLAGLSVTVDDWRLERHSRETAKGFTRVSTVITLSGAGATGQGEDVIYEAEAHNAWRAADPSVPIEGEWRFADASAALDERDLFPAWTPTRPVYRHYRRWAVESALLDLALSQGGTTLGRVLERDTEPVRFVASPSLGEPPTADRVRRWLELDPTLEFKLDATDDWTPDLESSLAETEAVRILDCKAHYDDPSVGTAPDPERYARLVEAFPGAVIEDPGVTEETEPVLEPVVDRIGWDAPIESIAAIEDRPWPPRWINLKPSRLGTVETVLDCIETCLDRDIALYGGGQFELAVGRGQAQALAALFYPDGPNDLAPVAYNDPEPAGDLPSAPLTPPTAGPGFGWSGPVSSPTGSD